MPLSSRLFSRSPISWRSTTNPAISTAPMITVRWCQLICRADTVITRPAVAVTARNGDRLKKLRVGAAAALAAGRPRTRN